MDIYSRQKRSEIMSGIRTANTKPEMVVRQTLHKLGYRFRLHRKDLPGSPDIVLPRHQTVIFVHGCFWHHHTGCLKSKLPTTNVEFWTDKIMTNVRRDRRVTTELKKSGWQVFVIWECEVKNEKFSEKIIAHIGRVPSNSPQRTSRMATKQRASRIRKRNVKV
jgi:DNA mismatch endonuclease (patch repair protein)